MTLSALLRRLFGRRKVVRFSAEDVQAARGAPVPPYRPDFIVFDDAGDERTPEQDARVQELTDGITAVAATVVHFQRDLTCPHTRTHPEVRTVPMPTGGASYRRRFLVCDACGHAESASRAPHVKRETKAE